MLFLGPLYAFVATHLAGRINHFPLVRLVFYSVDKTIFYLIIFLAVRFLWRKGHHRRTGWRHELKVAVFASYLLLLLMLTAFRGIYFPWQLEFHFHRDLGVINWTPFVETFKLRHGLSQFDFWYQSVGNVLWFIPFGFGLPWLTQKSYTTLGMVGLGGLFSLTIEALQFVLITGVSDIDDVLFNTLGAVVGLWVYRGLHLQRSVHGSSE